MSCLILPNDFSSHLLDLLQVPPFRKLRQEKTKGRKASLAEMAYYDWAQMRTAFTGSLPMIGETNPYAGKVSHLCTNGEDREV